MRFLPRHSRPSRRRPPQGVLAKLALSVAACVGCASMASVGSWAAWTVTDANSGNTLKTTTILVEDNQGGEGGSTSNTGTALFSVSNLSPGSAATTECIGVAFTGTATPSAVSLSASLGGAGLATLEGQLTMNVATYNSSSAPSVTAGSNTNSGACTSYPSGGTNVNLGTQGATLQTWAGSSYPGSTAAAWYKFTVSGLPAGDSSCATYCGQTITIALTWTVTAS